MCKQLSSLCTFQGNLPLTSFSLVLQTGKNLWLKQIRNTPEVCLQLVLSKRNSMKWSGSSAIKTTGGWWGMMESSPSGVTSWSKGTQDLDAVTLALIARESSTFSLSKRTLNKLKHLHLDSAKATGQLKSSGLSCHPRNSPGKWRWALGVCEVLIGSGWKIFIVSPSTSFRQSSFLQLQK